MASKKLSGGGGGGGGGGGEGGDYGCKGRVKRERDFSYYILFNFIIKKKRTKIKFLA